MGLSGTVRRGTPIAEAQGLTTAEPYSADRTWFSRSPRRVRDRRWRGRISGEECAGDRERGAVNVRFARRAMRSHAMSYNGERPRLPPFPPDYRASGVLLHVTSLPSRYGVGDVGPAALEWIDRLRDAGQAWWQALPLGPTGYGDSPYQPQSSFAGNELLVSPDRLVEDGLLRDADCDASFAPNEIDYEAVIPYKPRLLKTASAHF